MKTKTEAGERRLEVTRAMLLFSFPYKSEKYMFDKCFNVRRYFTANELAFILPPTNWPLSWERSRPI